jgi:TRAP-type uncharacterized transport system fused permease subunit
VIPTRRLKPAATSHLQVILRNRKIAQFGYDYVLWGAFLTRSGAGPLFVELAHSITGKVRSGPAQATILSNALMAIISGSPVANVVTTGSFAMPLLNKAGYPIVTGAALLAVAATGSMFTPLSWVPVLS